MRCAPSWFQAGAMLKDAQPTESAVMMLNPQVIMQGLAIAGGGGRGPGMRSVYSNVVTPEGVQKLQKAVDQLIGNHAFYGVSMKTHLSLHLTNRDSRRRVCFSFDIPVLKRCR